MYHQGVKQESKSKVKGLSHKLFLSCLLVFTLISFTFPIKTLAARHSDDSDAPNRALVENSNAIEKGAKAVKNIIEGAALAIPQFLLVAVDLLLGGLAAILSAILFKVANIDDFLSVEIVNNGWTIMRDLSNMVFVLVLLLIAISTVLRIESYNYKKALPKLLIAAIAINFSKTIAGLFIDAGNILMLAFLQGISESQRTAFLLGRLQILDISSFPSLEATFSLGDGITPITVFISTLLGTVFLIISIIVVGIYVIILVGRIIALWILVIFSPLAFLLAALPVGKDAKSYANLWWSSLTKYILVGPVIAFFLFLAVQNPAQNFFKDENLLTGEVFSGPGAELQEDIFNVGAVGFTAIGTPENMFHFIVSIVFLVMGLITAQKLGIAGSGLAGLAASKIQNVGIKAVASPLRKVDRQLARGKYTKFLSPTVMRSGFAKNQQRLDRQAFTKPAGEVADFFRNLRPIQGTISIARRIKERPDKKLADYEKAKNKVNDLANSTPGGLINLKQEDIAAYDKGTQELIKQGIATESQRKLEEERSMTQSNLADLDKMLHDNKGNEISPTKFEEAIKNAIQELTDDAKANNDIIVTLGNEKDKAILKGDKDRAMSLGEEIDERKELIKKLWDRMEKLEQYSQPAGKSVAVADLSEAQYRLKDINAKIETQNKAHNSASQAAQNIFYDGKSESELKALAIKAHQPETERAERAAIYEELNELPRNVMEASDLMAQARDAMSKGEKERFAALMIKAAQDYNGNEILPEFELDGNMDGYAKFVKNILMDKVGMEEQSALRLLDDISFINENANQRSGSRLVGTDSTGKKRLLTEEEHNMLVEIEINKANPRSFQQNSNRLAYGHHNADGSYVIDPYGLHYLATNIKDIVYRVGRSELNPSALAHFALRKDQIEDAIHTGLIDSLNGREMIKAINDTLGKPSKGDAESIAKRIKKANKKVV